MDSIRTVAEDVFEIPGFLSPQECRAMIDEAEALGFESAGVGPGQQRIEAIRNNDRIVLRCPSWGAGLQARLLGFGLPTIDRQQAVGFTDYWRVYRYMPGQRFKAHKDGAAEQDGMRSRLTFMVYLNAGFTGGETRFRARPGDARGVPFDIAPETGKALLFAHERWHEGVPVLDGVKYAVRTDILYG